MRRENLAGRLERHSIPEPNSGCILFTGSCLPNGYGTLTRRQGDRYAHRIAWSLVNGPIPEGMCVCHKCDVRSCVNPSHLFLGTYTDNMQDMIAKGRQRPPRLPKGEQHSKTTLTNEQVLSIYNDQRPHPVIAAEHGVVRQTVTNIKGGWCWSHLTGATRRGRIWPLQQARAA